MRYDDGTFALQYASADAVQGRYTEVDADVRFTFDGKRAIPEDGATGTLNQDTLTVRYGSLMSLSDFEDAVYTLMR